MDARILKALIGGERAEREQTTDDGANNQSISTGAILQSTTDGRLEVLPRLFGWVLFLKEVM